jgi:signal transduction histidine kinase
MLAVPLLAGGQVRGCIALRRQHGEPFTDDDRRLVESVAAQAAVTLQNVQLHAETLHAAADLRAVLESVEQGVLMTDPAARVRFANRRLGELLGVDLGGSVGQPLREVAQAAIRRHLRDGEAFLTRLGWLLAHPEEVATDEVAVARPVARVLERYSGPVRDRASGELLGRIDVYSDVTEARRLERAKDEFLATASHELKTPITTLNGYLELLQRQVDRPGGPDPQRLRRYVATSLGELERLRRLNEDLLEVARIRAGRLTLQPTRTDLAALVRDHVERFVRRPGLLERGHLLVCRADQALVGQFDPLRLGQVLNNLLENALKYSPQGGDVVVAAERAGDEALVGVHDQGIGVPPEERERLFLPFFRAANASAGSPEGLGLGLYISRGIVEGHGGRLWVEPAPDGGSVFRVALPLDVGNRDQGSGDRD